MSEPRPEADTSTYALDLTGVEGPLRWPEVFGNDHPVELEVGSGKGLFLQNAATRNPDHNYIGLELSRKYAAKAVERVAKRRLANVRVWQGDAKLFLARFVPASSLRAAGAGAAAKAVLRRTSTRRAARRSDQSIVEITVR